MANRFTQLSTSAYKPLSLQEIMLVPMQRQAQHDQAQLTASEYASLQANRLSQDANDVDAKLNEFKNSANEITTSLLERGVDRNTLAKLKELKAKRDKEFSQQGLIGNAQANYNTATQFVKDLTEKKERQAGWSPGRAKAWAQSQVSSFKGTNAGDGTFNAFSGKELDDYVDANKWINDNIKNVAANIDPITLRKYGGVGGFETAWVSGKVKSLDRDKIIKSLGIQAQYDDKLQASLKQSGYFSGEKDPTNIGSYKIVKDNQGRSREVFVPASRFGAQLQAAAEGASYKETDLDYKIVTDHVGIAMMKKGMDEKAANDMIIATNSSLLDVPPVTYEALKSNFAIAKTELESTSNALTKQANSLKKQAIDPSTNTVWRQARDANNQALIKYNNASANLNAVMDKANAGMNNIQKRRVNEGALIDSQIDNMIKKIPSIGEQARGLMSFTDTKGEYETKELKKLGLDDSQIKRIKAKVGFDEESYKSEVKKEVMMNRGLIFPKDKSSTFSRNKAYINYINETAIYEKKAKSYLQDNPAASNYQTFDGSDSGKFASVTGGAQKLLTESFKSHAGQGWHMANTGESLDQIFADNKGLVSSVSPTNGVDINGNPIETWTLKDKDGVLIKAIPISRGQIGFRLQQQVGQSLMNSSQYKDIGSKMSKNAKYISDVSQLGIHQQSFSQGVIPNQELPDGTLPYVVKSRKEDSGIESFKFYRINKNEFLKNKKVVPIGNGNDVGGVDQLIDVLDAYQGR